MPEVDFGGAPTLFLCDNGRSGPTVSVVEHERMGQILMRQASFAPARLAPLEHIVRRLISNERGEKP